MPIILPRMVGVALFVGVVASAAAQERDVARHRLPPAVMNRFGPNTLAKAGQQKFLLELGEDLMVIEVGDKIKRSKASRFFAMNCGLILATAL